MKQLTTLLLSLLFCAATGWAQRSITGKVTDALSGEAMIGATVRIANTNQGAISDIDGNYTIRNVSSTATTVVVSLSGYKTAEVPISGDQADVALESGIELSEVSVIGSRNATRTKLETPVPVDVIPISSVISDIGQVDVNQILTYMAPSFQSARQTISDGTDHVDPAQLRGLGPDQVLVLINGKRRHQSALVNVNGTVNRGTVGTDLSAIPATAIDRIEILRDGAAAQYGSDAIAGVINIVLKKRTGVLGGAISYGTNITSYDKNYALYNITNNNADPSVSVTDGQTIQAGVNYGFNIGRRGTLNLTGEFIDRNRSNRAGTYTGQVFPSVNGMVKDDSILGARNLTRNDFDMRIGNSDMTGGGVMYNFNLGLSDSWNLYAFGGFNKKNGNATGFYRYPTTVVSNAKVYAPDVLSIYPNGFLPEIASDLTDLSTSLGVSGSLGDWSLDVSNTIGRNEFNFTIDNSVNFTQAAVTPNSLTTSFDAGGLSFMQNTTNVDLSRNFDQIMHGFNLAFGVENRFEQFGITAGEEASWKNYDTNSGAVSGAQVFAGFFPANSGKNNRNAIGLYADMEIDFSEAWMIGAALRFENYSDFGSTINYKIASRYKIAEFLSLRASASTGFRAPSMQQRFYAKTNTLFVSQGGTLVPVESGTFTNESVPARILGIPELKEETSLNFAVGITTRPAEGLELTLDYYRINIDDRIVLTNNFNDGGDSIIKAQLAAANAGAANFFANAVDTRSQGVEAVLSYGKKFGKHDLRFVLAGSWIDNEVVKNDDGTPKIQASDILIQTGQVRSYFNREDQSRIEVASPKSKISFTVNYKINKFGLMLRAVNFGEVTYLDPSINPDAPANFPTNAFTGNKETLDQTFGAKTVFDASVSYEVLKGIKLTVGGNNIFNTYQDLHTHSGNMGSGRFVYSRRVQQMGFNGAYWFGRVSFNLK